jgi:hypothetical protein
MKTLWNHRQEAEFLNCSPYSIRVRVSRGQIPFIKIGRTCRSDPDRIQEWVREKAKEPKAE